MRRSKLFTKTRKNYPADEVSRNAQLLIQAGYIHKEMAGVYDYLPLGLIVKNNIIQIIREEMNDIGGQEILMSALQAKDTWETSGRWSEGAVDDWFKTELKSGTKVGLGFTHEEPLTKLMGGFINSYKDLPSYPYQFQTKFRNELRSKSGIMRCREFIMKDLYSFSKTENEHDEFYEKCKQAYLKIYERLGLGEITYLTFASGGSFAKFSHEFQTVSEAGEDTIYVHEGKKLAINKEVFNAEVLKELGLDKKDLIGKKAIEVGNIFTLGTRFSEPLGLTFANENGDKKPVFMGSYGVGLGRVMGAIAEHFADEKGLVWPENIAPAQVYLAPISDDSKVIKAADELYEKLQASGLNVLYDDSRARAGEKFADADLLGIPYRVVISPKTLDSGGFELKKRTNDINEVVNTRQLLDKLATAS